MLKTVFKMLDEPDDRLDENESLKLLGLEFMISAGAGAGAGAETLEVTVSD